MLIVTEYLSDKDEQGPLTSPIGHVFRGWLRQAGIDERDCHFTSVLQSGTINEVLTRDKQLAVKGVRTVMGKYFPANRWADVERLWSVVDKVRPNVILALGDLSLWALTSEKSLKFARGRVTAANSRLPWAKVVPTFSPIQIMSEYSNRPILLADLAKAKREDAYPELRRPQRFLHIAPSINDLHEFYSTYLSSATAVSADIETKGTMITCVGFAPDANRALVIPFFDENQADGNYWRTAAEERQAWQFVERVLREKKSFGQNYQYDMGYLWRQMGIPCRRFSDDTMLLHHALQPEMQKGLGFLASIYTNELAWKFMHKIKASDKSAKKGDVE